MSKGKDTEIKKPKTNSDKSQPKAKNEIEKAVAPTTEE